MSEKGLVVEFTVPQRTKKRPAAELPPKDSVPRIARLLALAHKWEGMVRRGDVKDYAEIARRMGLSRARVTQICSLTLLAPTIQDKILDTNNTSLISAARLRRVLLYPRWHQQQVARWVKPMKTDDIVERP